MITLNKSEVQANARQAYFDGRLQALHAPKGNVLDSCRYRDDAGRCCVIGASLDEETAALFDTANRGRSARISVLMIDKKVATDDFEFLNELQNVHDGLVVASDADTRQAYHGRMLKLLEIDEATVAKRHG